MTRWHKVSTIALLVGLMALTAQSAEPEAPARVAPIYALPKDGVWVEFDFEYLDVRNKEHKGKMQVGSVGQEKSKTSIPCRWIEIKMAGKTFETRWGKLLVSETVFTQGQTLEDSVAEAYHQEGVDGKVLSMSGNQISDYFTMGIRGELKLVKQEELETKLGKLTTKRVMASGAGKQRPNRTKDVEDPVHRTLEYRAWLTNEVPFGVARFEVWGRVGDEAPRKVFWAEAVKTGTGAKSEMMLKKK